MSRPRNIARGIVVIIFIFAALILALALAACGDPASAPIPQPVVCATYQDSSGVWREEDHERVDDDPCDLDDAFEFKTTTPKPKPQPTPKKTTGSIGGKGKKF